MRVKGKKVKFYYGWVIVAIAFISMAIAYPLRYSFSVFSVAMENEFAWSRASNLYRLFHCHYDLWLFKPYSRQSV